MADREENARLVERMDYHSHLAIFKFQWDDGVVPDFVPGQFTSLGVKREDSTPERTRWLRRAYSIASSPNEKDSLELYIVLVDEGKLTPKLWQLEVGDRIWMDKKINGHFTLDPVPDGKDLVLVSTGTGLAPYVSMMRTFRNTGRWRKLIIVNGVRVAADLGYVPELEEASKSEDIVFIPMVTREPDWGGLNGRVNILFEDNRYEELVGSPLDPEQCHVFLCGNPDMITTVQERLEPLGFQEYNAKKSPDGNIHFERYW